MGIALSTAGVKVCYSTTKDGSYTVIPDIKSVPELNAEPSSLDSTTLSETEYKTYIPGLKDLGGAISFTANFTEELQTSWSAMVTAAAESGVYIQIIHPSLEKSVFFLGKPSALGLPEMSVDSILETNCYITVMSEPTWETKKAPTVSA